MWERVYPKGALSVPSVPPIHHIGTPSCVSVPRTLVTSMSRCARDPPPREPSPRCARGAPGGEREPHPVKKAPVPPPSRPQLKRLEGGGGRKGSVGRCEARVAGVAGSLLPDSRPLALSGVLLTSFHFSRDAGDPRGRGAG